MMDKDDKRTVREVNTLVKEALKKAGIEVYSLPKDAEQALYGRADKLKVEGRRFNRDIERLQNAALPKNHIIGVGRPGPLLLAAGIPDCPVQLAASRLVEKSRHPEHPFSLNELRGLPFILQRPMAVFRSATREGCKVVVTDRTHEGKNFIVVIEEAKKQGKERVNSIRTVHYRNSNVHIANWINSGLLLYADKQKMSEWLSKQRYNSADVEERFRHAAKIMKNFGNPKILKQIEPAGDIFFSNALKSLQKIRQDKATPAQWLAMLEKAGGIKKGEDEWTGLSQWLKDNGARTLDRKEVEDYITSHAVVVKEWEYKTIEQSARFEYFQETFNNYIAVGEEETESLYKDDWYRYAFDCMIEDFGEDFDLAFGYKDGKLYVNNSNAAEFFMNEHIINENRLVRTTHGLDFYKELALFSDDVVSWHDDDDIHFGEVGNIQGGKCLAWVRFGGKTVRRKPTPQEMERMRIQWGGTESWQKSEENGLVRYWPTKKVGRNKPDSAMVSEYPDGFTLRNFSLGRTTRHTTLEEAVQEYVSQQVRQKVDCKVLVIDEVQSSRHQEGLDKGYQNPEVYKKAEENYHATHEKKVHFHNYLMEKYGWRAEPKAYTPEERQKMEELEKEYFRSLELLSDLEERPPLAPFAKNWHELCMKRMLRYAAENGFDKVVWTSGESQVERYNLSEILEEIEVQDIDAQGNRKLRMVTNYGDYYLHTDDKGKFFGEDMPRVFKNSSINEVVGKEFGKAVMELPVKGVLKSDDATIDKGRGMKAFYDGMLPQFMNRYGKKWGIRTEAFNAPWLAGNPAFHGVDVTPEMKRSVMQGQPMFMRDRKGRLYGYSVENRIYLTEEGMNPETMLHEYTHVWALAMQRRNPQGWREVKELLKDTPVWKEVMKDRMYSDIHDNPNLVASETLARISGRENAGAVVEMARKSGTKNLLQRVHAALDKFWGWVGQELFGIHRFRSVEEVTDRVLYDLAKGTVLDVAQQQGRQRKMDEQRVSEITVYAGRNRIPHIKCRIDGQWQSAKSLKGSDRQLYRAEDLTKMAVRYYREELEQQPKEALGRQRTR